MDDPLLIISESSITLACFPPPVRSLSKVMSHLRRAASAGTPALTCFSALALPEPKKNHDAGLAGVHRIFGNLTKGGRSLPAIYAFPVAYGSFVESLPLDLSGTSDSRDWHCQFTNGASTRGASCPPSSGLWASGRHRRTASCIDLHLFFGAIIPSLSITLPVRLASDCNTCISESTTNKTCCAWFFRV